MRRQYLAPTPKTFADVVVKRHAAAALTWLSVRDTALKSLPTYRYFEAAGHLRAIQYATHLTPPQVCDLLHIYGWRRRHVMPQYTMGYRFRMTKAAAVAARTSTRKRHEAGPSPEQIASRPTRRPKRFKLSNATPDPLAP